MRKLSRLRDFGTMGLDPKALTWSQRVCEQIETAFADQQAQIDAINAAALTAIAITGPAATAIKANVDGTIKGSQLPRDVQFTAGTGSADHTADGVWSFTESPVGGVTATIGASTGTLNITGLNTATDVITVQFTYLGVTRAFPHIVTREDDPPTNAGTTAGGSTTGTSASTTTLGDTTGTAYDTTNAVSATLTAQAGANGNIVCSVPLSFLRSANTVGAQDAWGKWQWRVVGGVFADIAAETKSDVPAQNVNEPPLTKYDGYLSLTQTKTGLTSGTAYEFRFLWRNDTGATALTYDGGTLTAAGN